MPDFRRDLMEKEEGGRTYGEKEDGNGGKDGGGEEEGDYLGWRLGVGSEDVVDFLELAVSKGLVRRGNRVGGILLELELEDLRVVASSRAKRSDEDLRLKRLRGGHELDRDVFQGLLTRRMLVLSTKH